MILDHAPVFEHDVVPTVFYADIESSAMDFVYVDLPRPENPTHRITMI